MTILKNRDFIYLKTRMIKLFVQVVSECKSSCGKPSNLKVFPKKQKQPLGFPADKWRKILPNFFLRRQPEKRGAAFQKKKEAPTAAPDT